MGQRRSATVVAVLLLMILGSTAILMAAWLHRPQLPSELTESSDGEPIRVRPQPTTVTGASAAVLDVELDDGGELLAPPWSGVITAVHTEPGATLRSGDRVAAVDGVHVIALASETPLFRRMALGTVGDDVRILENALAEIGFDVGIIDGAFDAALAGAVWALNESRGATGSEFDPSAVIWLPADSVRLADVELQPGALAPSQGQRVATLVPAVLSAALADPEAVRNTSRGYVIEVGRKVLPVSTDGSIAASELPALDALVADLNEQSQLDVSVRYAEPVSGFAIPGSAVVPGETGYCVMALAAGGGYDPVKVELLEAGLGRTIVQGELAPDVEVSANPPADAEC